MRTEPSTRLGVARAVFGFTPFPAVAAAISRTGGCCPKPVDFLDEMPRDPNGELSKRRLRAPYGEGRERPV